MLDAPWINYLREFNVLSVLLRLSLSVLLSGIVGYERELKGQPAGLRTHMLVCLGSALAILSNLYVANLYNIGDPTRIAAQVVSGIGFLGAGAIVVTGRRQVRGLTTAAGLWSSACMGIALGAGFFEGALATFGLMMIIIVVLHGLDEHIHERGAERIVQLYVEFADRASMLGFIRELRRLECHIGSTEISAKNPGAGEVMTAFFLVRYAAKGMAVADFLSHMQEADGVLLIEGF